MRLVLLLVISYRMVVVMIVLVGTESDETVKVNMMLVVMVSPSCEFCSNRENEGSVLMIRFRRYRLQLRRWRPEGVCCNGGEGSGWL